MPRVVKGARGTCSRIGGAALDLVHISGMKIAQWGRVRNRKDLVSQLLAIGSTQQILNRTDPVCQLSDPIVAP